MHTLRLVLYTHRALCYALYCRRSRDRNGRRLLPRTREWGRVSSLASPLARLWRISTRLWLASLLLFGWSRRLQRLNLAH